MVLTLGDEREYAGNGGYADELQSVYRYDSLVPNHKRIAVGDLLILRNKAKVLGTARVSRISSENGHKELRRCPKCLVANIKIRKYKRPKYKCRANHEFKKFIKDSKECMFFAAHFDGTFRSLDNELTVKQVRVACPKYNGQLAMQELRLEQLNVSARRLLQREADQYSSVNGPELLAADDSNESYVPDERDERKVIDRQIRERRGQKAFRNSLRQRFADTCPVTGCQLADLLEAAHINPHRGDKDNHRTNGLLLRADIHTLFDLNLIGIEPNSLRMSVNPRLTGTEYERFDDKVLECAPSLLNKKALVLRWKEFQSRLLRAV
ncbi:HNH endonuclease [Cystobacter fuscus]